MSSNNNQEIALEFFNHKTEKNYNRVYAAYYKNVYSTIHIITKDDDSAKFVTNTVFIKIWEKIHQYNPNFAFITWISRIAKNEALGFIQSKYQTNISTTNMYIGMSYLSDKQRKTFDVELYNIEYYEYVDRENAETIELVQQLMRKSMDRLSKIRKEILQLREFDNLSYLEICDIKSMSMANVKSTLFFAKQRLIEDVQEQMKKLNISL
jgi:RNA polymerase sigma-70 factor (ECF subfamily)